jgi:hypothetical protein
MTGALLMVIVVGTVMLALTVDVGVAVAWLARAVAALKTKYPE